MSATEPHVETPATPSSTPSSTSSSGRRIVAGVPLARTGIGRLFAGQTAIDFVGRRMIGVVISALLIVATVISLFAQGLNLGIDFTGGVSWDVPAQNFTVDDAATVLGDNGFSATAARIQYRAAATEGGEDFVKVQVGDQPAEVGQELRATFADAAGVDVDQVNVNLVSSSWGAAITEKAVVALIVFLLLVSLFISIRFEWQMAVAAIVAMLHDVLISVGIYSIFQFIITPPTVIAFLTILGYSLYDTIVVFDRIRENEARFAGQKPPYGDIVNVSMNQVLMRSLTTSFSSIVPVVSLLLIGAGFLGQGTLAEFAVALLVGMVTGAYSSIFVASPLLYALKERDPLWASRGDTNEIGDALRAMVMTGDIAVRKARRAVAADRSAASSPATGSVSSVAHQPVDRVLSHPPRPRKKKRR